MTYSKSFSYFLKHLHKNNYGTQHYYRADSVFHQQCLQSCRISFKSFHFSHPRKIPPIGWTNSFTRSLNKFEKLKFSSTERCFHTSSPNQALPGFVYLLLKPVLRGGAMLFGRVTRKWWAKLTPEQKKHIISRVKRQQSKILGVSLSGLGIAFIYYFLHLETCPITGRQKFIIIKSDQMKDLMEITYEELLLLHRKQILPKNNIAYARIATILNKLFEANKDYMLQENRKLDYTITIIDDPTINAFVLPDGKIFIFTGILNMCPTDDELATILSHELSHTLLNHVAEKLSQKTFLEIFFIIPIILIWFLLPDLGAIVTQVLLDDLKSVMFDLPFERDQESEADEVGLKLMARACYDVRIPSFFWGKMNKIDPLQNKVPEFLSTHPSHENRQKILEEKVPEALELRKQCKCSPLGPLITNRPLIYFRLPEIVRRG